MEAFGVSDNLLSVLLVLLFVNLVVKMDPLCRIQFIIDFFIYFRKKCLIKTNLYVAFSNAF